MLARVSNLSSLTKNSLTWKFAPARICTSPIFTTIWRSPKWKSWKYLISLLNHSKHQRAKTFRAGKAVLATLDLKVVPEPGWNATWMNQFVVNDLLWGLLFPKSCDEQKTRITWIRVRVCPNGSTRPDLCWAFLFLTQKCFNPTLLPKQPPIRWRLYIPLFTSTLW